MFQVFAAGEWGNCVVGGKDGAATIGCLEPLFKNVLQGVFAIVGVALFVMLLVGGFNFLFSGGDQKKLEAAQGTITNAVIGLVVIIAAFLILNIIKIFTGVDVTQFNLGPYK